MRFRTYAKIPKSLAEDSRTAGGNWVAREKLHGAHFVVAIAGTEVHFGKRKEWLATDTPFFGWQLLADDLRSRISNVARDVGARVFFAYGELLGGAYPHPEVSAIPGLSAIQTGIWYAPDIRWVVFDLLAADSEEDEGTFLAHGEVEALALAHGLLVPPLIRRARRVVERLGRAQATDQRIEAGELRHLLEARERLGDLADAAPGLVQQLPALQFLGRE